MKRSSISLTIISKPLLLIAVVVSMSVPDLAEAVDFYVDPDFSGTGNGSAAYPWNRLDGSATAAWSTVNKALASSDVTIFFSAKEAGTDSDESSNSTIGIRRTDTSTHRLTLDGMSKYNSSDTVPSWINYAGACRYKVSGASYGIESGFSGPKRNYVTVRGFKIIAGGGKALEYWGGDHVLFEHNDFAGTSASQGSLVFFNYAHRPDATDVRQNGGCTDITFRNNVIHDSTGEALYIGGSSDTGLPGHSYITIENNVVYNAGRWGGQGDSIDIKDGHTNVVVKGNDCYAGYGTAGGIRSHSEITVENNVLHDLPGHGVLLNTYWGLGYSGSIIKNNLIFKNGGHGVYIYTQNPTRKISDTTIDHNTITYNKLNGINVDSTTSGGIVNMLIKNNILCFNQNIGIRAYGSLTYKIAFNDVYGNTVGNYDKIPNQTSVNGNVSQNPLLVDATTATGPDGKFWTDDDGLKLSKDSPVLKSSETGSYIGAIFGLSPPLNLRVQ